jgi:hypothetical protein
MQMLDIVNAFDSSHKTCQVLNVELLVLLQASERKRRGGSTSLPTQILQVCLSATNPFSVVPSIKTKNPTSP